MSISMSMTPPVDRNFKAGVERRIRTPYGNSETSATVAEASPTEISPGCGVSTQEGD